MKNFFPILILCLFLSACSSASTTQQNTNTLDSANNVAETEIDTTLQTYIEEYKDTLENETFPTEPTLYIKTDDGTFSEKIVENLSVDNILSLIETEIGVSINATIIQMEDSFIVNFFELPTITSEIKILDSIAKSLHKNFRKNIIFRLNNKEYNSPTLYFGIDEAYPNIF